MHRNVEAKSFTQPWLKQQILIYSLCGFHLEPLPELLKGTFDTCDTLPWARQTRRHQRKCLPRRSLARCLWRLCLERRRKEHRRSTLTDAYMLRANGLYNKWLLLVCEAAGGTSQTRHTRAEHTLDGQHILPVGAHETLRTRG